MLPLSTEHKSDIKDDVVGPAPAPSPCKILCPTGLESTITAFKTPLILPMYELRNKFFKHYNWLVYFLNYSNICFVKTKHSNMLLC